MQARSGREGSGRTPRAAPLPGGGERRAEGRPVELETGALLRRLVDLASHRSGAALALMGQAGITFPQLIVLARVERLGTASVSALAAVAGASLPATSQMLERLTKLGMLARTDDPDDRRRRALALTARGSEVLARIAAARAADYAQSLAGVSPALLRSLAAALRPVVDRLEGPRHERSSSPGRGSRTPAGARAGDAGTRAIRPAHRPAIAPAPRGRAAWGGGRRTPRPGPGPRPPPARTRSAR